MPIFGRGARTQLLLPTPSEFGRLDILVNNAGILGDKTFKKTTEDLCNPVIAVHLKGAYNATRSAYQRMLEQGTGGRIIMTSSTSDLLGNFGRCNYGAAKAGITVNVLAPNAYSRMTSNLFPEGSAERLAPERVSPAIVRLCSDEAKEITGRQFVISGNRVVLLYPAVVPIADKDAGEGPWTPQEIGERIQKSMSEWPEPINVGKLLF